MQRILMRLLFNMHKSCSKNSQMGFAVKKETM